MPQAGVFLIGGLSATIPSLRHRVPGGVSMPLGGVVFMKSSMAKHSIVIAGHKTSVSLEKQFWDCLREIAERREETVPGLIAIINKAHRHDSNLSSAIRQFVLRDYQHRTQKMKAAS
jgi:predicted DNA-binding ribbon-helix-helix protein